MVRLGTSLVEVRAERASKPSSCTRCWWFRGSAAGRPRTSTTELPSVGGTRRLVAAGCSRDNHCLVYYERAGRPSAWLVTLFHWTPDVTRLEFAGIAPAGLKTVEDVRKAVLSGAIKGRNSVW